jgi:hypothetical protein
MSFNGILSSGRDASLQQGKSDGGAGETTGNKAGGRHRAQRDLAEDRPTPEEDLDG